MRKEINMSKIGKEFKELSDFTYEDFIIEDYYPDPIIKFPLSVG